VKFIIAIVIVTVLTWAASIGARTDAPLDYSDPALVKEYIVMPCDGLDILYSFLYQETVHLTNHYKLCVAATDNNPNIKYGNLMCFYVKLQWELMYKHAVSVEKAWQLMCTDTGDRKNPEYKIDF
jgi:hypothetical protein